MIVRKTANGEVLLVGQTDHSQLVGQMAAHWGNGQFARPEPYESVARAAAFHDYGWLRYETIPNADAKTGAPLNFRDIPTTPDQLKSYQWCVDWMSGIDPYSGAIVSMHRTGLWRARYGTIAHPEQSNRKLSPEIEGFIAINEPKQEQARATLGADQLWTNYRLLQVWDLLGLYFCCQEPYHDFIEPVPLAYNGDRKAGVRMTMTPQDPRTIRFDPFPFDTRGVEIQLSFKRMSKASYPDQDSFRRSYFQADTDLMRFKLI